jgi:hypothetical protein
MDWCQSAQWRWRSASRLFGFRRPTCGHISLDGQSGRGEQAPSLASRQLHTVLGPLERVGHLASLDQGKRTRANRTVGPGPSHSAGASSHRTLQQRDTTVLRSHTPTQTKPKTAVNAGWCPTQRKLFWFLVSTRTQTGPERNRLGGTISTQTRPQPRHNSNRTIRLGPSRMTGPTYGRMVTWTV